MRQSNAVLRRLMNREYAMEDYQAATYSGVAKKTLLYLLFVVIGAFGGIALGMMNTSLYLGTIIVSSVATVITSIIAFLVPTKSKVFGSLYCLFEGVLVGFTSMVYSYLLDGAVITALVSTFVVFAVVTTLFLTNVVKVNGKFFRFLITFALSFLISEALLYLIMMLTNQTMNWGLSLGVSVVTVFLAALYLLMDLDTIRRIVEGGMPKEMEWYASFGLSFTLVWLYLEILRIVAIAFSNKD